MQPIDEAGELFKEYADKLAASGVLDFRADLAAEIKERLKQLSFILQQLDWLEVAMSQLAMVERVDEKGQKAFFNLNAEPDQFHFFAMRLFTESFYYFAFRVRQILRNKDSAFIGFGNFESPGVRDVRNHLIEHPERPDSRIFNQTFSFAPGSGMSLKTGRKESEPGSHDDAGLRANATEFVSNLTATLKRALAALEQGVGEP